MIIAYYDMRVIPVAIVFAISAFIYAMNPQVFSGANELVYDKKYKQLVARVKRYAKDDEDLQSTVDSLVIFDNKKFNRCWVAEYLPFWNSQLREKLREMKRVKTLRFLQIGVFEGLSLMYLNSLLRDYADEIEITCIDDFSTEQYFNTYDTFVENTRDLNVRVIKKDSIVALGELIANDEVFDFIYCSGSRKPFVCFVDFALLSRVVKPDSYLLLDTYYSWSSYEGDISPDIVRDVFIDAFKRQIDTTDIGRQKLLKFKEPIIDNWVAKEKPSDCSLV
jgi:hypothetical protein